jgi:hypothetical protein
LAGGRPAAGHASFDRQRLLAALAVVALLGSFGAALGRRLGTGRGVVAASGRSGSGGASLPAAPDGRRDPPPHGASLPAAPNGRQQAQPVAVEQRQRP